MSDGDETYWKVLDKDGCARYGNNMQWSLPKDGQPGDWHEIEGELEICKNGLHLTTEPDQWWGDEVTCFLAEFDGEFVAVGYDNKIAVRRARLVRPATDKEFENFRAAYLERLSEDSDEEDEDGWDDDWDEDDFDDEDD